MSRAAALGALLVVAGLLSGCTKISEEEFAERFEGQDGVVEVSSSCGALNCSGTVTMADTATADQLEDVASELEGMLGEEINEGTVSVDGDRRLELVVDTADRVLGPFAEALALAVATPGVQSLALVAGEGRVSQTLALGPEVPLPEVVALRQQFLDLLDAGQFSVVGGELRIDGGMGADLRDEIDLAVSLDRRYPLAGGSIRADEVLLRVAENEDLAPVQSFVAALPGYADVPVVDVSNRRDLYLSGVDPEFAPTVLEMVRLLRTQPGFLSLTASSSYLRFDANTLDDAARMDRALDDAFGERYAGAAVTWEVGVVNVGREPGGLLLFDLAGQLAGQGTWSSVAISEDDVDGAKVSVSAKQGLGPHDAAAALARTDLAELERRIELHWVVERNGRARFVSGSTEIDPAGEHLTDAEGDAVVRGWAEGLAAPGEPEGTR